MSAHGSGTTAGAQPANASRLSRPFIPAGRSTGSASPGEATVVTQYRDTTLHDRLHNVAQISDRQYYAACRIAAMWHAAGLSAQVTQDYRAVPEIVADPLDAEDLHGGAVDDDDAGPLDRYRRLMRKISRAHAEIVDVMLGDTHPGCGRLATLQAALDGLADALEIEREGIGV
jgi:hypothetical protein